MRQVLDRSRGVVALVIGAASVIAMVFGSAGPASAATGGASVSPGQTAQTRAALPPQLAGRASGRAGCQWHTGQFQNTQTFNPDFNGGSTLVLHTFHTASYCGSPRIGDVFYTSMYAGIVNPLSGDAPSMGLVFDGAFNDAYFEISQANPVICLFNGASDPTHCSQSPSANLTGRGAFFGGRALGVGQSFEVLVPISVRHPKSGIGTGNAALFGQSARMALSSDALATQWVFVSDRPNEITNLTSSELTNTGAKTQGDFYNYYRAGTITFELGTTAGTYELGTQTVQLDGSQLGASVWSTWTNLAPGRTFHWRAKLVANGVAQVVGPDQTFTTTGTAGGGGATTGPPGGGSSTPVTPPTTGGTPVGTPGAGQTSPTPVPTPTPAPAPGPTNAPFVAPVADTASPLVALDLPSCGKRATRACTTFRATRPAWRTVGGSVSDAGGLKSVEVAARLKAGTKCSWYSANRWKSGKCSAAPAFSAASISGSAWKLTFAKAIPGKGTLRLQVRATDLAGNTSPISQRSATLR